MSWWKSNASPPPYQPVTESDLAMAHHAALKADQLRLLDRTAVDNAAHRRRWNAAEDALAMREMHALDPTGTCRREGDGEVDVRLNSPTIYQHPHGTGGLLTVIAILLAILVGAIVVAVAIWCMNQRPNVNYTPPELNVDVVPASVEVIKGEPK